MRRPQDSSPRLALALVALVACLPSADVARADGVEELLRRALEARDAGDLTKATELADEAVAAEPENARGYRARAALHEEARNFEKLVADCDKLVELEPDDARAYQRRGAAHFRAGHVEASIRDFDKHIEMKPGEAPYQWQRGIALYYAGRYADGREQFESHQTVNASDVENAAWHYLCVARVDGVARARAKLIPVSGDQRIPMAEVYALLADQGTAEGVLAAARAGGPEAARLKDRMFYAHLYIGLFHEAAGEAAKAREHIGLAAGRYRQEHYMGDVARVHAARLREADAATDDDAAEDDAANGEATAPADAG